jgi:hypothetical protein
MTKIYQSYMFRHKDPVIDELRTMVQDEFAGKCNGKVLAQIESQGGPSAKTMQAWFFGKTRRPQNPTVEAAGRAIGYQRVWRKMNGVKK